MSRPGVGILARLALILGGVGGVLLTPPFALSFFLSYGADEQSRAWLTRLRAPLLDAGLLVVGSESRYDVYGLLYLAAWGLALAGLVVLVRRHWAGWPSRLRRAWGVVVLSLGAVAVGILGDYGPASDVVGAVGFVLTMLGFLSAAAGCGMLGRALRREYAASWWSVGGRGRPRLVGHIPSGPGLGFLVAGVVVGLTGKVSPSR